MWGVGRGGRGGPWDASAVVAEPPPPPWERTAPSNDYQQHFVDTGERPQNSIRDVELSTRFSEFPAKRELLERKEALVRERATQPAFLKCDLRSFDLRSLGTAFDVILVDPPWDEYARRATAFGGQVPESWTWEEIQSLKLEDIADTPSFVFLWCGSLEGVNYGRQCLHKWGFRRVEDICWLKTNTKRSGGSVVWTDPGADTVLVPVKEHCLVGMRGNVRRSSDGHLIHANCDTDVIVSEEPPYGSSEKPDELYHIIEHFVQGRRRLELFGEDHNIRPGWLTLGKGLSSSHFDARAYAEQFAYAPEWVGPNGNPQPGAPWLLGSTPEVEALRPKSPQRGGGGHGGNSTTTWGRGRGGGRGYGGAPGAVDDEPEDE